MSCGCISPATVQSWNDFDNMTPRDPLELISLAMLGSSVGRWALSETYHRPSGASVWIASPITITNAAITANGSDSDQQLSDAAQWNFQHIMTNSAATIAPPVRKIVFMKAGTAWTNVLNLAVGSSPAFTEFQLSFMDNAACRGDEQGTIPVIRWTSGPYTGSQALSLVLKNTGRYTLGLVGVSNNSTPDWSMFEIDIIAV